MSILSPKVEELIREMMKHGGYSSADDVVLAGIASLKRGSQSLDDFARGEMDALLEEGEKSGPSLDGEQVLAELRTIREAALEKGR